MMKKNAGILAVAMMIATVSAHAYEFTFDAEVSYTNGSLSGVGVGTRFTGRFVGNDPKAFTAFPANRAEYGFASGQVSAVIAGHKVTALDPRITLVDDFGGNVEDHFRASGGYPLQIDGRTYNYGAFGIDLASGPGNTGVLVGNALPASIDVGAFDAIGWNYGYLQRDGGPYDTILSFKVLSVAVVPEPGPLALVIPGLLVAGVMARRRTAQA